MRLGLFTDCFPNWPLMRVVRWAADHGYRALEVAAWPRSVEDHATHVDVAMERAAVTDIAAMVAAAGIHIVAVSCYQNLLDEDGGSAARDHLIACCDAAARLGVRHVGMFVGRDPRRTIRHDLAVAAELLPGLVAEGARRGVTLVVENCPMTPWHPDGQPGNLAYSPELWEWLDRLGIGLNFDPSHLPSLGIDPIEALRAYGRPALFQAKGVEFSPDTRNRTGYIGPVLGDTPPWWRYRTPGLDDLDWPGIISALRETGYTGPVIVEEEDPVLGAADDAAATGLTAARDTLAPLIA